MKNFKVTFSAPGQAYTYTITAEDEERAELLAMEEAEAAGVDVTQPFDVDIEEE